MIRHPQDLHVTIVSALMGLTGVPLLLFLVLIPAALLRMALGDVPPDLQGPDEIVMVSVSFTFGGLLGLLGLLQVVAAWGLWRERPWSRNLGLGVAGVWALMGLLPLAGYALFALVRERVGVRFEAQQPEAAGGGLSLSRWVRAWEGLVALLYLGVAAGGASLMVFGYSSPDMEPAAGLFFGGPALVAGIGMATLFGVLALRARTGWRAHAAALTFSGLAVCPPLGLPAMTQDSANHRESGVERDFNFGARPSAPTRP